MRCRLPFFPALPRLALLLSLGSWLLPVQAAAQSVAAPGRGTDAATTALALRKLTVLGSVLYVAAHPDDENTRLIAWLANEKLVRTGYLSLTRGDGGQNLIGPELREKLGLIRTQELLAARRIDGGEQFFTRANDFGFSKSATEALRIWDKEQVLADVVRTIRRFRPDVIITRFSPEPMNTHGHHTASAQLALEAFSAAADPKRFPEQLAGGTEGEHLAPWQAKRILWNTSQFFFQDNPNFDKSGLYSLDVGGYNALLGKSYGEIAALSRSQHRSQGFGSAGTRGEAIEYFKLLAGEPLPAAANQPGKADLLAGVDVTWGRAPGAEKVRRMLAEVVRKFDPARPEASVQELAQAQFELSRTFNRELIKPTKATNYWHIQRLVEMNDVLLKCSGVFVRATATDWSVTSGQSIQINLEIVRRTITPVMLWKIKIPEIGFDSILYGGLELNKPLLIKIRRTAKLTLSQPYWLRETPTNGMYRVSAPVQIGAPENLPALNAHLTIGLGEVATELASIPTGNAQIAFDRSDGIVGPIIPILHRRVDPADGEIYRPLAVVPPVAVSWPDAVEVFPDKEPRTLTLSLKAGPAPARGTVRVDVPTGWRAEPAEAPFDLTAPGAEQAVDVRLTPPAVAAQATTAPATLRAVATLADGRTSAHGQQVIHYPHIPDQVLFPEAAARLVRADVRRGATHCVGYVTGAGDDVPAALRNLGYSVTLLTESDLSPAHLKTFDAVVLGIRAWNTLPWLPARQPALLAYVEGGGTLITQYNTTSGLLGSNFGPYPLKPANKRVTDEAAPVELLAPQDPLLTTPNRITAADFQGWVQEQGLYYPEVFDPKYTPLLRSHDPDEAPLDGALLVARYGKGTYVYTGLSFFRQLPAGVPGAMRLFANLLAGGRPK